jgi:hypothetical protein
VSLVVVFYHCAKHLVFARQIRAVLMFLRHYRKVDDFTISKYSDRLKPTSSENKYAESQGNPSSAVFAWQQAWLAGNPYEWPGSHCW